MTGPDKVFLAEEHGIVFQECRDGWYWRAAEDDPRKFRNGPFGSKEAAADDFVSGVDYLEISGYDDDEGGELAEPTGF
jgi:hypothetical protein